MFSSLRLFGSLCSIMIIGLNASGKRGFPSQAQKPFSRFSSSQNNGVDNPHIASSSATTHYQHHHKLTTLQQQQQSTHFLPAALKNLGHTCYLNSVIQSLYYSPYRDAVLGEVRCDADTDNVSGASVDTDADIGIGATCAAAIDADAGESECEGKSKCGGVTAVNKWSEMLFAPHSVGAALQSIFRQMDESSTGRHNNNNDQRYSNSKFATHPHTIINPSELVTAMGIEVGWQEDAHEFYLMLLQQVDESVLPGSTVKREGTKNTTTQSNFLPSSVLMGSMQQTIECLNPDLNPSCYRTQTSPYAVIGVDLLPPLPSGADEFPSGGSGSCVEGSEGVDGRYDLHHYLYRSLLQPEYLTGNNQLHVQINSNHPDETPVFSYEDVKKYSNIAYPLPHALFVHLHRFAYDVTAGRLYKVKTPVLFPLLLDLQPYMSPDAIPAHPGGASYELSTIIVHLGNDAESGHYITYLRRNSLNTLSDTSTNTSNSPDSMSTSSIEDVELEDVEWIKLDDAHRPQIVTGKDVMSTAVIKGGAYILGYTKILSS